jgi:hypothetical protein
MAKRLQRKSEPKTGPIIEPFDAHLPDDENENEPPAGHGSDEL